MKNFMTSRALSKPKADPGRKGMHPFPDRR
jgi:hypothetical protein